MKKLILLVLPLLLFPVSTPVYADDFQDGFDAYNRKDYKVAFEKWMPLAEQGDAYAQSNLGLMYAYGRGVTQDYKGAVKWYRLSAEQGNATAQYNLGTMYDNGQGVTQDDKEAVKWYRLSAEQGNALAQLKLGVMYDKGQGVIQDYVEAHKWFNIAGANGNELGRKNRDIIEKRMTLDQIAEAQKLAREWMEKHGKE